MKKFALSSLAATAIAHKANHWKNHWKTKGDVTEAGDLDFTSMGKISKKIKKASYINLGNFQGEDYLVVTENPAIPWLDGNVSIVKGIKDAVLNNDVTKLKAHKINTGKYSMQWPNNARPVPDEVFTDGIPRLTIPDGFTIWGHRDGGIYLVDLDPENIAKSTNTKKLTQFKDNFWYHTVEWIDFNGDGRLDILTARTDSQYDTNSGELIWLEQPEDPQDEWKEHFITNGTEVFFTYNELPEFPGEIVVWSPEFYQERISFYRIKIDGGELVDGRVIDDSKVFHAYSAKMVDLNGNGKRQLLVNNWERDDGGNKNAGYFVYEFPDDIMTGEFKQHKIASGFDGNSILFGGKLGAPGYPYPFYPDGKEEGRAHILLCGHGDYKAYLLTPTGDESQFEYEKSVFADTKGVIGSMTFSDFDGDGRQEVYIANYQKGYVEVFSTSEAAKPTETEFLS